MENFRGGLALVGERGPELVNLPRGSDVIPNVRGGGGGSRGGGGNSLTVIIEGNVMNGEDFSRAVNEARLRWERAGNA